MERYNNIFKVFLLRYKIAEAKKKLADKDYVGRKIAEVLLLGTDAEIIAIKQEYSDVIAEAKTLRNNINAWEAEIKKLNEEIKSNQ